MHINLSRLTVNQVRVLSNLVFICTLILLVFVSTALRANPKAGLGNDSASGGSQMHVHRSEQNTISLDQANIN